MCIRDRSYPTPSITFGEASGTSPNDGNICNGTSAVLTASGGSTYSWSTGATTASFTTSEAGKYTFPFYTYPHPRDRTRTIISAFLCYKKIKSVYIPI